MDINDFAASGMFGDIPDAFRKYLGLEPLDAIVRVSMATGATRLFICPSFEPIEAITIVYGPDGVTASYAVSDEDVWERIACGGEYADSPASPPRSRRMSPSDLPAQFQNWDDLANALNAVDSCMSDNLDGVPYYHFAFGERVDSAHAWFNPTPSANLRQWAILQAYHQIKQMC